MAEQTAAYKWCCSASLKLSKADESQEQTTVVTERIHGDAADDAEACEQSQQPCFLRSIGDRTLDITASPGWMEYIELIENRSNDYGGAGAYDVFRCDLILPNQHQPERQQQEHKQNEAIDNDKNLSRWRIWGEEFHLNRLKESYRSVAESSAGYTASILNAAVQASQRIVQALLQEAEKSKILNDCDIAVFNNSDEAADSHHQERKRLFVQVIRLTLLWSPPSKTSNHDDKSIIVRGHASSTGVPMEIHCPVEPIVVSVAARQVDAAIDQSADTEAVQAVVAIDTSMPNRINTGNPHHKIASWTRVRKEMERPEAYKAPGVSEVIMLLPTTTSSEEGETATKTQLLEGLSSNVFVLYTDGTLRTAQEHILPGYARQLVLECAETCGLVHDPTKLIYLEDASHGLWKEAFITSSSRILFPIAKLLVPGSAAGEYVEHWHDPVLTGCNSSSASDETPSPKWKQLYDEILRRGGY